jgi:peptide/nickel transport system ATP-binding protein/oligopeptide transport system ATP-binding protein
MPQSETVPDEPLLEVSNLSVHFPLRGGWFGRSGVTVKAVEGVSFAVAPREILGLVGESGSGKSTLARAILRLTRATSGAVRLGGTDLLALPTREMREVRRRMQMIFQDPYASLNPRMTAGDNIAEGLLLQGGMTRQERTAATADLLDQVGLSAGAAARYPHEFSGGQRQRIGIARALAVQPALIVADEPVSALDMSIQAQILNLLLDQQERRGLALLFIGHDLSVIRHFCDRVMVLYLGRIAEIGPTEAVFRTPRHPYTRALIDAAPVTHPRDRAARSTLGGEPPSPLSAPAGCPFNTRCAHAIDTCRQAPPMLRAVGGSHFTACIRDDLDLA